MRIQWQHKFMKMFSLVNFSTQTKHIFVSANVWPSDRIWNIYFFCTFLLCIYKINKIENQKKTKWTSNSRIKITKNIWKGRDLEVRVIPVGIWMSCISSACAWPWVKLIKSPNHLLGLPAVRNNTILNRQVMSESLPIPLFYK